jgi:hypothetical protein
VKTDVGESQPITNKGYKFGLKNFSVDQNFHDLWLLYPHFDLHFMAWHINYTILLIFYSALLLLSVLKVAKSSLTSQMLLVSHT